MFATESPKKSPVDDGTQLFKTPEDERASEPGGKSAGPPGPAAATEIDGAPDRPAFSAPVIPLVEWREAIDPSGADLDMSVFTPENLATMTNTETQPAIAEKWSTPSKIQALPLFHFTRDLGVKILHSFDFHKNLRGQNVPSALMGLGNQAEMVEVATQKLWSRSNVFMPSLKQIIIQGDPQDPSRLASTNQELWESHRSSRFISSATLRPTTTCPR